MGPGPFRDLSPGIARGFARRGKHQGPRRNGRGSYCGLTKEGTGTGMRGMGDRHTGRQGKGHGRTCRTGWHGINGHGAKALRAGPTITKM